MMREIKFNGETMTVGREFMSAIVSNILLAVDKYNDVARDMYTGDYVDAEMSLAELGQVLLTFRSMGILEPRFWVDDDSEEDQEDEILEFMGVC